MGIWNKITGKEEEIEQEEETTEETTTELPEQKEEEQEDEDEDGEEEDDEEEDEETEPYIGDLLKGMTEKQLLKLRTIMELEEKYDVYNEEGGSYLSAEDLIKAAKMN